MGRTISTGAGRAILMGVIALCFVGAMLSLFFGFGGGAIGNQNQSNALFKLLGFYIPLLTLVGTFLFRGGPAESNATPLATFLFAVFISSLWVLTPILLLLFVWYIEDVLDYIDKLIPVGQSLALMALGYYFTKGGPEVSET